MPGMGPAPKDPSRRARRNATIAMTQLPAEGRTGAPPRWPLPPNARLAAALFAARKASTKVEEQLVDEPTPALVRELARLDERMQLLETQMRESVRLETLMWFELWATPQAVMWERLRWTREVAQYCRLKVLAELGDLDAAKEARQIADRIGLTPLALLRLRWEIEASGQAAAAPPPSGPPRGRYGQFRLVHGTGDDAVAS